MKDKQLGRAVKKYIKEIKSYLICDCDTQRKFVSDVKNRIYEHIDSGQIKNAEDIYIQIGEPQEIVKGFLDNADVKKIKRKMNIGNTVLIGVVIALVIWAVFMAITIIDAHDEYNGYFVDEMYDINDNGELILEERTIYSGER